MKLSTNQFLVSLLLAVLAFTDTQAANHCVVLQYHHFSEATPRITSVTPKQFDDHLDYLKKNDFQVLPLREVVHKIQNAIELPNKCISLTVDDAFLSVYTTAYPKVKALNWSMTVFVNSKAVDEKNRSYMSWEQMREMSQHGFSFENHSHSHQHLIRKVNSESQQQWLQRISKDILTAQKRINSELGRSPVFFAHPYGEYNNQTADLIRQMGLTGFGQQSGPIWKGANMQALPRFPMAAQYAELNGFITKVNTLPLPLTSAPQADPELNQQTHQPSLTLTLEDKTQGTKNLQCFVNGNKDINMTWINERQVVVTPNFKLPAGRSRTNCTMPSNQKGRFHWFSQTWIKRKDDGNWYHES